MNINSQTLSLILSIGTIILVFTNMNKEEKKQHFKSMTSEDRKEMILKEMKSKVIEVGSSVPNKNHDKEEVRKLIRIANFFPGLRDKSK